MIILGLDPGTRITGYGVLECGARLQVHGAGVLRLSGSDSLALRLHHLQIELQALFERFRPEITVVEKIFFGKNADSAFKLGHARGVCLMAAAQNRSTVSEYAAKYVKKAVTGSGAASKEEVRWILTRELKFEPIEKVADVSDALALAFCHIRELEIQGKRARAMEGNL